ncbi:MAG: MerR family transcriptional regulator [Pleurocapsa sp. SU_196_0]|nr:MerR family transcriptional regulator [Pleurocapsa sp. SU_196_0]
MRDLVPPGRFAQLARLSRKALRLYAEMELLRPASVNPDSGYRYYALSQLEDAHRIYKLRELGMSLEAIRETLRVWGTSALAAQLEAHRAELLRQAAAVQVSLENIDQLLSSPPQQYAVYTRQVTAQRYLGRRSRCDPDDSCAFIEAAQQQLLAVAKENLLEVVGTSQARYDEQEDFWEIEVCLPIAGHAPTQLPRGVHEGELAAGMVAFTVHRGACGGDRGLQDAYGAVWSWVREHGHEIVGDPMEVYVFDRFNTVNPADYRTEVAWMIR